MLSKLLDIIKDAVAIDPAGSQYIDYANTFTHAH